MMNYINNILQVAFLSSITYLVLVKITNYKENNLGKTITVIICSIFGAILGVELTKTIQTLLAMMLVYLINGVIVTVVTKFKIKYSVVVTFIALMISYLAYIVSVIITAIIINVFKINIATDEVKSLFLIVFIQCLILYIFFKQKRLKNGIQFLQDDKMINSIGIIGFGFIGITIIIYSLFDNSKGQEFIIKLTSGLLIEAICLFIWIKKKITIYYKQKLKEQTVADLQNEIKEKDNKINEILEENKAIATINHKYSSRIKALEEFSSKIVSKPELVEKMKTEFGEDYTAFSAQIKRISQEYSNEMKTKVTKENAIPKTGIFGIDTLLEHMSTEATKSNISLDVKINASIKYMVEDIISESALETLLGDHIKDAIIAINCSNNTNRRILVVISIVDKCYEINFYDTGIEFEIDTLIKLGKEQITTHKETGRKRNRLYDHIWDIKQNKGKLNYRRKVPNE